MTAGEQREAVHRVVDQLCSELGYRDREEEGPAARSQLRSGGYGMPGVLTAEDESLVATMSQGLAKIAAAVAAAKPPGAPEDAVSAALDGAEMVIRGELVSGNADQLAALLPSFVFLVALPIVEQDEALVLSRRTSELIEEALGA